MWLDGKWEMNFSGPKAKSREALKTQQLTQHSAKRHHTEGLQLFQVQSLQLNLMLVLLMCFQYVTITATYTYFF